jgi:hypothetical protein
MNATLVPTDPTAVQTVKEVYELFNAALGEGALRIEATASQRQPSAAEQKMTPDFASGS